MEKCPRNHTVNKKKVEFGGEKNGLNFKLKYRKAQKSILSVRFFDTYKRAGDQCSIWETPDDNLGELA